jgi:hypothetical protein
MNKPTWKKGDILALPADLAREGVYNGCSVFKAEHDPSWQGEQIAIK